MFFVFLRLMVEDVTFVKDKKPTTMKPILRLCLLAVVSLTAACSAAGFYGEAEAILRSIDTLAMSPAEIRNYYAEAAAGTFGSTLNLVDPVEINKIQRAAVENSRLGIPLIFARDVIHGFHTIFPIPLGQAASFDPTIVEEGARHAAREAVASGVRWTFSPMVDISRDSRWGRIAESFGEDPYLTSELAVAMLNGYQNNEKPLAAFCTYCQR